MKPNKPRLFFGKVYAGFENVSVLCVGAVKYSVGNYPKACVTFVTKLGCKITWWCEESELPTLNTRYLITGKVSKHALVERTPFTTVRLSSHPVLEETDATISMGATESPRDALLAGSPVVPGVSEQAA